MERHIHGASSHHYAMTVRGECPRMTHARTRAANDQASNIPKENMLRQNGTLQEQDILSIVDRYTVRL